MKLDPETIEVSIEELERLVDGARQQPLNEDNHRKWRAVVETLGQMARRLAEKDATVRELRQMLLKPATTEKTRAVLERAGSPRKPTEQRVRRRRKRGNARGTAANRRVPLWERRGWRCPTPRSSPGTAVRNAAKGKCIR